jgi:hypothetical protein
MPVEKFRSAEAMQAAPVTASGAAAFDRFLRHCARYWAISPRVYPRGVFKFRSIEDAQAARQRVASRQADRQSSARPATTRERKQYESRDPAN